MFDPVQAFALDDITTVYYDEEFRAIYVRNDTDYLEDGKEPAWLTECKKIENPKNANQHETFYKENKGKIRKAAEAEGV